MNPSSPAVDSLRAAISGRLGWRSLGSALVARTRFAWTHGMTHADSATGLYNRDYYQALGYNRVITYAHYRGRFERGGIAKRIVKAAPSATWTGNIVLTEDPDPKVESEFETAAQKLYKKVDVWGRILRADILSGIGRYGVLMIGAPGPLDTPLPTGLGADGILYLQPLSEGEATVHRLVEAHDDPRFGLPLEYELTLSPVIQTTDTTGRVEKVHWSRVIHIAENTLTDEIFGEPRQEATWNYQDDLDKIMGGGAEAAWQRMAPGIQLDLDPDTELSADEATKLDDEMEEYFDGHRRAIRTRGVDVKMLSSPVAGFGPNANAVVSLISSTTGIPKRLLMGSERGELSSSQDRSNWADRIAERRRLFGEPLIRQFTNRLIDHGALPSVNEYEVVWPKIDEMNESEKATIISKLAQANASSAQAGGGLIMTADEIRHKVWGLGPRPPEAEVAPQVSRVEIPDKEDEPESELDDVELE